MEINYADRTKLKQYFKKNNIPKETDFSEFIDASLNQREDGIVKLPGDPLSIEAVGEKEGIQRLMNFYKKLSDTAPAWSVTLNDKNETGDLFLGLNISIEERSMLFISEGSGQVGIGTSQPSGKLNVVNKSEDADGGSVVLGLTTGSNLRLGYHDNYSWVQSHGDKPLAINPIANKVGIGTVSPSATLHVKGSVLIEDGSLNFGEKTRQMLNLWKAQYGIGVQSWTSYSRTDRNFAWYIGGTHGEGEIDPGTGGRAAMVLRNGSLGIGTTNPKDLTHIAGNLVLGLEANNQKFIFHPRTNAAGDFLQITYDNPNGDWNWSNGITLSRENGNVGISTPEAKKRLHVGNGELRVHASHNNTTADIGAFYAQNLSQGIGIGYNRIEAIGSNPVQHIYINPKGNGGKLFIGNKSALNFNRYELNADNVNYNTGVSATDYVAAIVGFKAAGGDINEGGGDATAIIQVYMYANNGTWWIRADFKTHIIGERWTVDVMYAVSELCSRTGM